MKAEVEAFIQRGKFVVEVRTGDDLEPTVAQILSGLRTLIIEICNEYEVSKDEYSDVIDGLFVIKDEKELN